VALALPLKSPPFSPPPLRVGQAFPPCEIAFFSVTACEWALSLPRPSVSLSKDTYFKGWPILWLPARHFGRLFRLSTGKPFFSEKCYASLKMISAPLYQLPPSIT